jgi:hypothetical protein
MIYDNEDCGGYVCYHGFFDCEQCQKQEDELIEANGGIDKCMNCGKYKYGNQLNKDQVCKIGCRNPMEY